MPAVGGASLPHLGSSLLGLKLQLLWPWLQLHAALTYQSRSTAMLTYMSVFNPLLRSPAQTHCLNLTVFLICKVGFNILVFTQCG